MQAQLDEFLTYLLVERGLANNMSKIHLIVF